MANISSSNSQEALVPKLRFPGFEGEWSDTCLKAIAEYLHIRGQAEKKYFISTENINQDCAGITPYKEQDITEGIAFNNDDLLLANIRPYLKKLWKATFKGICSTDVLAIRAKAVNPNFLYYAMCREAFFNYVMSGAKGSKMPRGDKTHIMDFCLALPSEIEQKKIAEFISCLEKRIAVQRQLVKALKSYKRGVIEKFFDENSSSSWEQVKLSEILTERKEYCEKDGSYIHATLSKDGISGKTERYDRDFLVMSEEKKYKVTHLNDLCYNPANLKFGVICINAFGDAIFSPIYVTFEISPKAYPAFVGLEIARWNFINKALRYQQGTVYERTSVSPEDLLSMNIMLPPMNIQKKLSNIIQKLNNSITNECALEERLVQMKNGLMRCLFI